MEFHLFLPQLRLSFERLVASAQAPGPVTKIPVVSAQGHHEHPHEDQGLSGSVG